MDFSLEKTALTLNQVDSLYWLGRYTERVFTTLRAFSDIHDNHLDSTFDYAAYCQKLDIYNGFTDLDDFCMRYAFDLNYASSIISSIIRAYDNAIVLRDTIGSDALSYIEMAQRAMQEAETSHNPALKFQRVKDCIMAFKGTVFDAISDRNVRNIIMCGMELERIDIYLRLSIKMEQVIYECRRLADALSQTDVQCDRLQMQKILGELCEPPEVQDYEDKMVLLQLIDGLFVMES